MYTGFTRVSKGKFSDYRNIGITRANTEIGQIQSLQKIRYRNRIAAGIALQKEYLRRRENQVRGLGTHDEKKLLVKRTQCRLKYCTALSCASAALRVANVPRFLRFPVLALFLRE